MQFGIFVILSNFAVFFIPLKNNKENEIPN